MARIKRAAALDLGTTYVTCMLGELTDKGLIRIAGHARARADGWHLGAVVHPERAMQTIVEVWQKATKMAGFGLDQVQCSVTGTHLKYIQCKGSVAVRRPQKGISEADVRDAIDQARAIALPQDRMILHTLPIHYIIDGQKGVFEPRGLFGRRLEVEAHLVHAAASVIENIHRVVEDAGLRVQGIILRGIAAAMGGTDIEERKTGVGLVHLGAQTEIVVYRDAAVRHNVVLELGGEHVTSDISLVLRVPQGAAERLKVENGVALAALVSGDEPVDIALVSGKRQVSRRVLASIIEPRVEEILSHVEVELRKAELLETLRGGIVLTGGMAQLAGVVDLAEQVLNLPVRVATGTDVLGPDEVLANPAAVPAIGLVRYALREGTDSGCSLAVSDRSMPLRITLARLLSRALGGR